MKRLLILVLLLVFHSGFSQIPLKVSSLFSNHMVLQQQMQIPVWGTARPLSTIQVVLAGFTATTITDNEGNWMVYLPSMNAGGPFSLHIIGDQEIHINDVMIGEVWIASGQSNMEWAMNEGVGPNTQKEIAEADYPAIRYFLVEKSPFSVPRQMLSKGSWAVCSPETVGKMSAVGYSFAREMFRKDNVAVGVICSYWGATRIEAWTSSEMLQSFSPYTKIVEMTETDTVRWNQLVKQSIHNEYLRDSIANVANEGVKANVHLKDFNDDSWPTVKFPVNMDKMKLPRYWGFVWLRKKFNFPVGQENQDYTVNLTINCRNVNMYLNGNPVDYSVDPVSKKKVYKIRGEQFNRPDNVLAIRMLVYWGYAVIGLPGDVAYMVSSDGKTRISLEGDWKFNSGMEPELPQRQDYNNQFSVLFNGMIAPLVPYGIRGVIWYQGEQNAVNAKQYRTLFPMMINDWRIRWKQGYFPFLFVQLANYQQRKEYPSEDQWADLREAQLMTLNLPQTGMAVAIDLGEANDIHPKNKLPVGYRLFLAAQKVAFNRDIVYSGPIYDTLYIEGSRIRLKFKSTGSGLVSRDGQPLKSFAIADSDRKFVWANAVIEGNDVIVSSSKISKPVAVRYAWDTNPDATLYNMEGLPASPFRTDTWRVEDKK
jgi:sialate O-acetylesterase